MLVNIVVRRLSLLASESLEVDPQVGDYLSSDFIFRLIIDHVRQTSAVLKIVLFFGRF